MPCCQSVICFTCGRCISMNKQEYLNEKEKIMNDPNKTDLEKEKLFSALVISKTKRICCRIRIMGEVDYPHIMN